MARFEPVDGVTTVLKIESGIDAAMPHAITTACRTYYPDGG